METDRLDDAFRAASAYYLNGQTMEQIAATFGTSRFTVSRLISLARTEGLVEFRLRSPNTEFPHLEQELEATFGIAAHVVPTSGSASEQVALEQVAESAALLIGSALESGMVLGVAWGTTMEAVSRHLVRKPTRDAEVVQLNGAGNTFSTGIEYASEILGRFGRAFDARVQQFPVPTFFDFPETRQALWRERSIQRVLALQQRSDVMCFSVGAVRGGIPSHVYSGGYLEEADFAALEQHGVVGDVATVFFRRDGTSHEIPLNSRSSGPLPSVICQAPRRICIVSGVNKVQGLRGALAGHLVTDLVVDVSTADALLRHEPTEEDQVRRG